MEEASMEKASIPRQEKSFCPEYANSASGRLCLVHLDGKIYCCRICHSHLAEYSHLISKDFHCENGKAYLFETVVNIRVGELQERLMTTGLHTIADIFCLSCGEILGWKYETAQETEQKYKEGKFILIRKMIWLSQGPDLSKEEEGETDLSEEEGPESDAELEI